MKTNITFSLNITTIILICVILLALIIGGSKLYHNKIGKLKDSVEAEVKLRKALTDTVGYYINERNEWVAERRSIQTSIKNLENMNLELTENQKELLQRVKEVDRKNNIITAALVQTQIMVDSLLHDGETFVDTSKGRIIFSDRYVNNNKEMTYKLTVGNVKLFKPNLKPTLMFDSLYFPNKQFIEFHWIDDKKEGYPVSFSITNSNEFFSTVNVDSYAIPEIDKQELDPDFGQKLKNFFNNTGDNILWIGIGVGTGTALTLILSK
jgi:hypothetical protein